MEVIPEPIKKLMDIQEKVKNGEAKLSQEQEEKMNKLIEAYQLSVQSQKQLTKVKTCVLYERLVYIGKCQVLEKTGFRNQWGHPFLQKIKTLLYEENQFFELAGQRK